LNESLSVTKTVLIISFVVLAASINLSLLGIGEGQASLSLAKGAETWSFVDGCAEDALLKLRNNASYAGGNVTRPEGTCTVSVSQAGSVYTLTVSTNATLYKRTVEIVANRGGNITITSWKEI
jgi:hypothetical protein